MMFSSEEIERYARHIVLHGIGGPGQQKLKAANVLVIGAGGLGAPVLQYLAAAGVGNIACADDDEVSLSNLQRQIIHGTPDVGRPKVESAADAIARLNPNVRFQGLRAWIDPGNADDMVTGYDLVVDGSDNFTTRYVVSDACFRMQRPLVTGAVGAFDGSITTLRPFETSAEGSPNPTYRCLFPDQPPEGLVPACSEAGIIGALPGLVGSLMALEAIRQIVGFGEGLVGRLLLVDAFAMRFETMAYEWDPANPLNGVALSASR